MRLRSAAVAMVVLTALTAAPADAGRAPKTRRAMLPYALTDRNHGVAAAGQEAGAYDGADAYVFELEKGENAVSVMVLDDSEGDVSAVIAQWVVDGQAGGASYGHAATYEEICTKTAAPVRVVRGEAVEILLQKGTCEDGTPSTPTEGDIFVDFHRT